MANGATEKSGMALWRVTQGGWVMKFNKRSIAVVPLLFALLLSLSTGTLNARDADFASRTFAAAQLNGNASIPVVRDIATACP